jgi:hypothetical protein
MKAIFLLFASTLSQQLSLYKIHDIQKNYSSAVDHCASLPVEKPTAKPLEQYLNILI